MKRKLLIPIGSTLVLACSLAIAGTASRQSTPHVKQGPVPPTVTIGDYYQQAGGCQDTGSTQRVGIPHPEVLDLSYTDPTYGISGVQLVETTHVGSAGIRNVGFDATAGVLKFDIWASGGGSTQCVPFGPCGCVGATGASYGVRVIAHYVAGANFRITWP